MSSIRPPRRFLLVTLVAAMACTADPILLCGCSPAVPSALLYGRVTDAAGAPVHDARVTAQLAVPDCAAAGQTVNQAQTAVDGRYRMVVPVLGGDGDDRCLRAFATFPVDGSLRTSDTIPFTVQLSEAPEMDSTRVDLVLRAP